MKSPYYVATIVNAYRHALDGTAPPDALLREVCAVSHRPYCSGFYFGPMPTYEPDDGSYIRDCVFAAVALDDARDGRLFVEQKNRFLVGDILEVLRPGAIGEQIEIAEIINADGASVAQANHAAERVTINCPLPLCAGDMLRLRSREGTE